MMATRALFHRQPMIRFMGKRIIPTKLDHAPHPHPESPSHDLPESFASYRERATQHGPLKTQPPQSSQQRSASSSQRSASHDNSAHHAREPYGNIGGYSAKELGPIKPAAGEVWDRSELPKRFHRVPFSQAEIDAIETGGASMFA